LARNIETILKITNAEILLYSGENKIYKFTNSDYPPEDEYIYIPMTFDSKDKFKYCAKHLQNPNCKGIFIANSDKYTEEYFDILYKYSPENVFAVKNVYNTGYQIAQRIANSLDIQIIILAGTDLTREYRKKLALNLKLKDYDYKNYWQKMIDSVLRADENDKYAILETDITKPHNTEYTANIKENAIVLYSKVAYYNIPVYKTVEECHKNWMALIENSPSAIYANEENDLLNFPSADKLHISENSADLLLKDLGIKKIKEPKQPDFSTNYTEQILSPYTIKRSLKSFINANADKDKIIILQKIPFLDNMYENSYYENILQEIPDKNATVILIDIELPAYISRKLSNIKIKEFKTTTAEYSVGIKNLINYIKTDNTVYFIASGDENLCSII